MPESSASSRRQAFLLALFIAACAAFLAWRLQPRDRVDQLLSLLPLEAAVVVYADAQAAASLLQADPSLALGLAASGVQEAAFALKGGELYGTFGGNVLEGTIEAALASRGVRCAEPLAEAPCAAAFGQRSITLGLSADESLVASTKPFAAIPSPLPSNRAEDVRDAIAGGAIAWAQLDPKRLAAELDPPPAGLPNLALLAKALQPAEEAFLLLEGTGGEYVVKLRALCTEGDAEELEQVLAGLNEMGAVLLRANEDSDGPRLAALESFRSSVRENVVEAAWTLQAEVIRDWVGEI